MPGGEHIDNELILRWWNDSHPGAADTVTDEIRSAYIRQVVHAEAIARFDASVAGLLSPSEWTHVSRLLPRHD
jgi:hypothetical protein